MHYVIRFTGEISWEGQMNGLPPEIYAFIIMDGYDRQAFNNVIEIQGAGFLKAQAMVVQRDQGQIIDMRQVPQDRMIVPMRWIVSIHTDIVNMTGELMEADEDGVERFKDGSEPVKQ